MEFPTCIFCSIVSGKIPATIVYQNDHVIVINDIHPKAPVHYLILPKHHYADMSEISEKEGLVAQSFFSCVSHLAAEKAQNKAFNLISNNGAAAGQSVFHLHWHFLSGRNIYEGGLTL